MEELLILQGIMTNFCRGAASFNKALQTDEIAVSHLLQTAQKLRHNNFAAEQRRYAACQGVAQRATLLA